MGKFATPVGDLEVPSLFQEAYRCLMAPDPDEKLALTEALARDWREGRLSLEECARPETVAEPGRPERPWLVAPRNLAPRRLGSREGLVALIHSLAHIEFNAVNLAWDAVYRFRGLPEDFYTDWVGVAEEEAYHFALLRSRLRELGRDYGDFDAHDGLWQAARDTAHDPLVRMALVPRVLEARGLDVTPGMMGRLRRAGDRATVAILEIIFRDEIGHVKIGSRWFRYLCQQRGLNPESMFRALLEQYMTGRIKGPFARAARRQAGFGEDELALLEELAMASGR
jgi:uncharacterized ferritin-like protein (DUF455 family)